MARSRSSLPGKGLGAHDHLISSINEQQMNDLTAIRNGHIMRKDRSSRLLASEVDPLLPRRFRFASTRRLPSLLRTRPYLNLQRTKKIKLKLQGTKWHEGHPATSPVLRNPVCWLSSPPGPSDQPKEDASAILRRMQVGRKFEPEPPSLLLSQ